MSTPTTLIGATPVRYSWRGGARIAAEPDIAAKEFERILDQHGDLDPVTIVAESQHTTAPLHTAFEWVDQTAADLYREHQARTMVQSLIVVHVRNDTEDELPPLHAYVKVSEEPFDMYERAIPVLATSEPRSIAVKSIPSAEEVHQQALQEALARLQSWRKQYQAVIESEFPDLAVQIDHLTERYRDAGQAG